MTTRLILAALALVIAVLAIPLVVTPHPRDAAPGEAPPPVHERMEGDVVEAVAGMDLSELPVQAEGFLATDRPWRAARVMRRYLAEAGDVEPDHRLLAARAEAGWGAWAEAEAALDGIPSLASYGGGIGLYLRGRARDAQGDPRGAAEAYRAFLALTPPAGQLEEEREAARLRLGLALLRLGDAAGAAGPLARAREGAGHAGMWLDILRADAHAAAGDTAAVRRAVAGFDGGIPGLRAWRARIEAAHRADDVAGARALANQARGWARTSQTQAEFLVAAAEAALEMGDAGRGRAALRGAIDRAAAGPHARRAAALLAEGVMEPADHLAVARVYRAQGLHEASLNGYRRWLDAGVGTAAEREDVRMEYANALFYAYRYDEVEAALRPIANQRAARMLVARTASHQGDVQRAVRIYRSVPGVQGLYLAASAAHDHGDMEGARELFEEVVRRHPGTSYMGLSLMRLAGMAFLDGAYEEAAGLWDRYRTRYPRGQLVLQATYWAGRAREEAGQDQAARSLFRDVRQAGRDSYYALLASGRLDEPFWPLPMGTSPGPDPAAERRVAVWMRGIDLLRTAGFEDEASAEVDRVVTTAGSDRAVLYPLAEALAERGYAQRAIRIGLRLGGSGPPSERLLRILHPFPYRTLITEEARDRDLDPFVVAALIRQESMFEARITSHVGARGLMQIMPATGRVLADAVGIDRWDAEMLYHPEINVHLGTRYLAQHTAEYDGSLPAVFSAYNAGAHRVEWWQAFPEFGRDALFTERIPFRETRDYVKILTRNLAVYRGLYGPGA